MYMISITGDCKQSSQLLQGRLLYSAIGFWMFHLLTVSSLPGTPLWLISVYSSSFAPLIKYWIPAFWYVSKLLVLRHMTHVAQVRPRYDDNADCYA